MPANPLSVRTGRARPAAFLSLALLFAAAPAAAQTALYRINSGGGAFTDSQGRTWQADQYFNVGNVHTTNQAIANTVDDALYQSERWDASTAPEMAYSLPLPSGQYQVRLHFAELVYASNGTRV